MLSSLERRVLVAVVAGGVLLLSGVVVAIVRWPDIKAWLDAPELLRVNAAAVAVPLPGEDAEEDPTRSAAAVFGALRTGWTELAPRAALEEIAVELSAREVEVDPVLCDDAAIPRGTQRREVECGLRVPVAGEELWVLATDHTPTGEVSLSRTAVWFAWDVSDMSWPLYERLVAADPVPYPFGDSDGPPLATPEQVEAALPARFAGVTDQCWEPAGDLTTDCVIWEGPVAVDGLPDGDGQAEALVHELVEAGFFVDVADPSWSGEPLIAHRFTLAGGWIGMEIHVRREGDGLVARVNTL